MENIIDEKTKHRYQNAAFVTADWYVHNQNRSKKYDANTGRYLWQVTEKGQRSYDGCWHQALATVALNEVYKLNRKPIIQESVELSLAYLRGLQILDAHFPESFGAFSELTPMTPWSDVRDGATVAWAFLYFFRQTGDVEYLRRARLFGNWLLDYGSDKDGWPYGYIYLPGIMKVEGYHTIWGNEEKKQLLLNCQIGVIPLYAELGNITGQAKFWERADHMASYALKNLITPEGYFISWDKKKNNKGHMDAVHVLNDDFSSIGLLSAYEVTGKKKYLEAVHKYISYIRKNLAEDGTFDIEVLKDLGGGEAVFGSLLWEMQAYDSTTDYRSLVKTILDKFLEKQVQDPDNKLTNGGFQEFQFDSYEGKLKGPFVCGRGTNYAIVALLKASGVSVPWLTPWKRGK